MANFINLTLTKEGGNAVSYAQLFDPAKMEKIRLNTAGDAIKFAYEGVTYESESVSTLTALQNLVNTNAPSGMQTYVGVFDPSANTSERTATAHNLKDVQGNDILIPANTRVIGGYYDVITTFTSPTTDDATISVGFLTDDAAGIVAATAIDAGGNVWDAGIHAIIQVGSAATHSEKTTASRNVTVTIGVEAVTAGKFIMYLACVTTPA